MSSSMNIKEIASAVLCIALGGFFALQSVTTLDVGTAGQMGPGYFPLAVSLILVGFGLMIGLRAAQSAEPAGRIDFAPMRSIVAILAAPVAFGLTVRGLGFVPALVLTALVASLAGERVNVVQSILLAAALAVFCVAVFTYGLGLSLPLFGPLITEFGSS